MFVAATLRERECSYFQLDKIELLTYKSMDLDTVYKISRRCVREEHNRWNSGQQEEVTP
jgi:hypothetical protein